MRIGFIISGTLHGALILWLLFGGLLERRSKEEPLAVAEVSILSEEDFAALTSPEIGTPDPTPEAPPEPEPAPAPQTAAPEVAPAPPARPQPAPAPIPEPVAEPTPEATETIPEPAERVAPEPQPEPEAEVPSDPVPEPVPEPAPEPDPDPAPAPEPAAPEAATTQIVTEADRPQTAAPLTSIRPAPRPNRPAPTPEPAPNTEPDIAPDTAPNPDVPAAPTEPEANTARDTAISDALSGVLNEAGAGGTPAPTGPPLSSSERDGLRISMQGCWQMGTASSEAMRTTVTVLVKMSRDGKPTAIELLTSNGPSAEATRVAFETARRSIIMCGANGFPLPAEKYDYWREIEMTFNPDRIR